MKKKSNPLRWNLLYLIILFVIGWGIYVASGKINYDWNWKRVIPYIINFEPQQIIAPSDGTIVSNKKGQLILENDESKIILDLSKYDNPIVNDGDLISQGDTLVSIKHWQFGTLSKGIFVTIKLSLVSLFFAIILGVIIGLMRIADNPTLKKLSLTYVEIIRGTPLLVQIFIAYFFIGTVFNLDRFTAGAAALSVFAGAYVAEIVRGGIQSIHRGQTEAAQSLGMNYAKSMIHVILPQAFRRILPPLAGQFINLIKDSSLVSVIAITDLTKAGREVVSASFAPFEVWFTVAALYLILTGSLSWAIQRLEKRLSASD
ncbi:MAG: amino acid ABC transporter permease [Ostreibacterium sp.]